MQTNELKDHIVKVLKKSIRDIREGHFLTSSMLFAAFIGIFTVYLLCFFLLFVNLWFHSFIVVDPSSEDAEQPSLETLYKSGLYVFGGWHEMVAHAELHAEYPDQDPQWCFAEECKVFVFPAPPSEEALGHLRAVGAAQNKCEESRQRKNFKDSVGHCRRAYIRMLAKMLVPGTKKKIRFDGDDKVFLFTTFSCLWYHRTFPVPTLL